MGPLSQSPRLSVSESSCKICWSAILADFSGGWWLPQK